MIPAYAGFAFIIKLRFYEHAPELTIIDRTQIYREHNLDLPLPPSIIIKLLYTGSK
jgi:hypothetical protein